MTKQIFDPVSTKTSLPALEEAVLDFWNTDASFEKSLKATKENKPFVFFDGPPFATGLPHYGHLLAGRLKTLSLATGPCGVAMWSAALAGTAMACL
jgi:isoleucyl-tRNA synthetase